MAKKIFKADKLDQMKERTTNMFQQCGTSGAVSPQQCDPKYEMRCRETELRISTLESTYRTPHFTSAPRHCVSDSNIFMHRDMDWYREPRPLSYESDVIQAAALGSDRGRVETFTTRVQTPGNVLVRFKTFLGMDGSTVEVVTDNSNCVVNGNVRSEENALAKMKNLFSMRTRNYSLDENKVAAVENRASDISKFDKMKNLLKRKPADTTQQITETVVGPAGRIIRMKTFFANRPPRNAVVIESTTSSSGVRNHFGKIKTLFKTDVGSQTDDISSPPPSTTDETQRNNKGKLKKILGLTKPSGVGRAKEDPVENIDDRQIFSRQSSLPAQVVVQEEESLRLPIWMDNFVKRLRASCSRARVNDIEIPNAVVIDSHDVELAENRKRRKFGSASGWRWRRADEVREGTRQSNDKSCGNLKCCTQLPKWTFSPSDSRQDGPEVPIPFTQVIALICGILVVILMALGLSSADWLMAAGWRQGLFTHCVEEGAPTPLPFNLVEQPGCYASREVAYIRAAAALCIVTLCADLLGSLLTALGLRATDHRTKYKYYRLAVLAMSLALISILIALVIYPVCFAAELNLGNRTVWEFGWAYGVGWGAAIFLFGAVILLLCDKESEEIYYKERKVERALPPGGA